MNVKKTFHLILETLADDVTLVVFGVFMLILVVCGVITKDALDMVSGGVFLGVCVGIVGNDVIERIVNEDEDFENLLDHRKRKREEGMQDCTTSGSRMKLRSNNG